jgi:RNA polymerase sigma-70 factor (ECF subfamily)
VSSPTTARFSVLPLLSGKEDDLGSVKTQRPEHLSESDEILMVRIQTGERDALSQVFRRYARVVSSIGRKVLRDWAEADDLVQEVFFYVYRRSELFDSSKGSARSWIIQVAYTQAFIRRRRLKSIGFYASGIADTALENTSSTNPGADFDQTVEALFGRNGWKQVLDSLTPEQKETLRLHFYEGYTFAEIAEKLGQSYANVRHHHYRGLEKLRKHLTSDGLSRR